MSEEKDKSLKAIRKVLTDDFTSQHFSVGDGSLRDYWEAMDGLAYLETEVDPSRLDLETARKELAAKDREIEQLKESLVMFCALSNAVSMIVRTPVRSKEWTDKKVHELYEHQCSAEDLLKALSPASGAGSEGV